MSYECQECWYVERTFLSLSGSKRERERARARARPPMSFLRADATAYDLRLIQVKTSDVLSLPIAVSEQYPKGLKHTVPEIQEVLSTDATVYAKTQFSMVTEELREILKREKRSQVVLCGIEAHACILQTAMDLMNDGIEVHVPIDAVSSQRQQDSEIALRGMEAAGAVLTTAESTILELIRGSDHPKFKDISGILKEGN